MNTLFKISTSILFASGFLPSLNANLPKINHPTLSTKIIQEKEFWVQRGFTLGQGYGNISEKEALNLWAGLGNAVLAYQMNPDEALLTACRKNMMALCSYKHWFSIEKPLEGDDSVQVTLALTYAYEALKGHLSKEEAQKITERLTAQLNHYRDVISGDLIVPWWPMNNAPKLWYHVSAMVALVQTLSDVAPLGARELKSELIRQWRKMIHILELYPSGDSPFGVQDGLIMDHACLTMAEAFPNEDSAKAYRQWLMAREKWYRAIIKPGQRQVWLNFDHGYSNLPWIPVLFAIARENQSQSLQHMTLSLMSEKRNQQDPWVYQSIRWHDPELGEDIDHHPKFEVFKESGWALGHENRRLNGAFFSFLCGAPGGKPHFDAWTQGRNDLTFEHVLPQQSSWSWTLKDRHLFGPPNVQSPLTENFNGGLLVNGCGEMFEPYPRYRTDHWRRKEVGGKLFLNKTFGESWILGGSFETCYPEKANLKHYRKVMIWLGPAIIMELSQVESHTDSEFSFTYNSPEFPLAKRPDGFYQKVSGIQAKSASFPQGNWNMGSIKELSGNDASTAKESISAVKTWNRCVLLTTSDLSQDAWFEALSDGIHLDFFKSRYQITYRFEDDRFMLKCQVNGKEFFNIDQAISN